MTFLLFYLLPTSSSSSSLFLKDTIQREIRKLLIEIKLIGNNLLLFLFCKRRREGVVGSEDGDLVLFMFFTLKEAIKYVKDNQRE